MKKISIVFALLCGVCASGQCPRGDLVTNTRTCPCNGNTITVSSCQGTLGPQGCLDFAFQNFCGSTCSVGEAQGCIPGGPKLQVPLLSGSLSHDIEMAFAKQPEFMVATCGNDNRAFARWLAATSIRRSQSLKGIGE